MQRPAGHQVGYGEPSQFSRDYKRLFGEPPMRDVEWLKARSSAVDRSESVRSSRDRWHIRRGAVLFDPTFDRDEPRSAGMPS
jgi:AraC-like DNA-binding protein